MRALPALAVAATIASASSGFSPALSPEPAAPPAAPATRPHITIVPSTARVIAGGTLRFRATIAGAHDAGIEWSAFGAGEVDASGTYRASRDAGDAATVVASVRGAAAAATISVVAPPQHGSAVSLVACYDDGAVDVRGADAHLDIGTVSIAEVAAGVAADHAASVAYVASGDRIAAFDPSTGVAAFSAPVPGARFSEVAVLGHGLVAATDNNAAAHTPGVRIFRTRDRSAPPVLAASAAAGDTPEGIALDARRSEFYVTDVNSNSVERFAFDRMGRVRLTGTAPTGHRPFGVAVDERRRLLFVADNDTPTVSGPSSAPGLEVFSLPSLRRIARFDTGTTNALPLGVAADPADGRVFVTNEGDGDVAVFSSQPLRRVTTIVVGRTPWLPAFDGRQRLLEVPNAADDTVTVIDARTLRTLARGAPTCGYPTSIAIF